MKVTILRKRGKRFKKPVIYENCFINGKKDTIYLIQYDRIIESLFEPQLKCFSSTGFVIEGKDVQEAGEVLYYQEWCVEF